MGGASNAEPAQGASLEDTGWSKQTRWVYYDKEKYRIYEQTEGGTNRGPVEVVAEGRHGLAKQSRVPLVELRVSEGLWLLNKAASLQLEHFNKSNALGWALTMGLFAMPVVYSERDWDQVMGESYYIQLGPQDRFGWTEPQGTVYQIAADNLTRLQEEIYRVCYVTHAGGPLSGNAAQSGVSKQRDYAITQEVLRAYGDAVKDSMKRVLRAVDTAREDGLSIDVSGMDEFDIGDFGTELDDAQRLLSLGMNSPTLRKASVQEAGVSIPVRRPARGEGPDRARDRSAAMIVTRVRCDKVCAGEAYGRSEDGWDGVAFSDTRRDRGICAGRAGEGGAGVQGGAAGRAQAARGLREASERSGSRESLAAGKWRTRRSEARRFAQSYNGWA